MAHARLLSATLLILGPGWPAFARAQQSVSLDDALREAHAANAQLPIAAYDAQVGQARIREARAALGPLFALDGGVHGGAPSAYAGSDGRIQAVATQPLYDGGALRAGVALVRAEARGSGARYRIAEKDLDLAVRTGYAEHVKLEHELEFRRAGVGRLRSYLSSIEARRAAGQGVTGDLLKTQVLLGGAEADVADAERRLDQARLALNDLLGRDPTAPLVLAPLPAPSPPPDTIPETWAAAPDVQQAEADVAAAEAGTRIVAAERRPHLDLALDAGAQPAFGPFGTGLNNGEGWGAEFTLTLNWPLFDFGGYRSRRTQAGLRTEQARQRDVAVRRQARLAWATARTELAARYREVAARDRTAATAQDSYLTAQSLYRGGGATALEVLEAYTTWIEASAAAAAATLDYRIADAQLIRWGTP
jgi:outer membrane protein TolC